MLTSEGGAGRLTAVGGLYAPLFAIGLCIPPPGMPMRRLISADGLTKLVRDIAPAPLAAFVGGDAALPIAVLRIGSDFPEFTP